MQKSILGSFIALCFAIHSTAQTLQSPDAFLGYALGSKFSRHHQVVDYFEHVAAQFPNQVKLEQYGQTNERRPLMVAFISSEKNMGNIETIRENNLKNAGILDGNPTSNDIAIVWLSYNVHGNESSSTEVAMKTIYELLTQKQEWLKNTLVIMDPCINPDGRDRYVNWYNETASTPYNTDQQANEHTEPWPGGRTNHYLFDLNRDWVWTTQVESVARIKLYNKWMPQIHVDFHEQGMNDPYYFAPAAEPFHEIITDWQRDFQTQIGKNNAKYFDANGWLFFTKEIFDLFYPSYGDTYPTFMGAIGMTYEQAGDGGLGILTDEGTELTLKDRIAHHTATGLSTVEMASKNAIKLNEEFHKFFNTSGLNYKSYLLQGNADNIASVAKLLDKHEIKYGYASNGKVTGYQYSTASQGSINTSSNDLVVSVNQPKGKMVKVLFEPKAKLSDSLTYDITAWSVPYAYGLEAVASTSLVRTEALGITAVMNAKSASSTAYMMTWNSLRDAEFLADLLKKGIKVRFTEKPLTADGKLYDRGALIITRGDNKAVENFDDKLIQTGNIYGRQLNAIASGFSTSGPDFGSPYVKLVHTPKVALMSGDGTDPYNYGEIWHFFEQQLNYPVTSLHTEHFASINLSKYNVLIMPSGNYKTILNDQGMTKLEDWIKAGGKVIAIDATLKAFADKEGFALKTNKADEDEEKADTNNLIPYADRERDSAKKMITGAIFKSKVDNTHPMAFGYPNHYFSLKQTRGSVSYQLLDKGYNVAYLEDEPKPVSGFAGSEALKTLDHTLLFGEERLGKGSLIYMVDNTIYRSFWENGKLFLVNAIFFVNNNLAEL